MTDDDYFEKLRAKKRETLKGLYAARDVIEKKFSSGWGGGGGNPYAIRPIVGGPVFRDMAHRACWQAIDDEIERVGAGG